MVQDIRWKQRFQNLQKAYQRLKDINSAISSEPNNAIYQIALIGAFQFTFELCWKTLKDYLVHQGVDVSLPRDVIKQAYHHHLIEEGELWIQMLESRNMMAYVYQEKAASESQHKICNVYLPVIEILFRRFQVMCEE